MKRNYLVHCLIGKIHHSAICQGPLEVTKVTLLNWNAEIKRIVEDMNIIQPITILSFSPMNIIKE